MVTRFVTLGITLTMLAATSACAIFPSSQAAFKKAAPALEYSPATGLTANVPTNVL
jgi:hypothetical protein